MQLDGLTTLVTGASRGIGRATALAYAREGADVIVHCGRARDEADAVAAEVRALGRRAEVVQADVAEEADVAALAEAVGAFCGERGLDVLLNNAGIYPAGSIDEVEVADFDRMVAVNVRGPFLVTRALLPLLRQAAGRTGRARVISISSVIPYLGLPGFLAYATSKAALSGFTHALAYELGPEGITANNVVPSMVATDHVNETFEGWEEPIVATQAVKRPQQPEDLTGSLVFLASAASDWVTGQTIVAAGGRVLT